MQSVAGAFVSVELWLFLVSGFVALLSIIAVSALLGMRYVGMWHPYWLPVFVWACHAAAFWNVNMTMRTFSSYTVPTVVFSSWGAGLSLHAFCTIVGVAVIEVRRWKR